jgi:hypothetical protein
LKNQEEEIMELFGDRYDERAVKDPREERRDEWSRWGSGRSESLPMQNSRTYCLATSALAGRVEN